MLDRKALGLALLLLSATATVASAQSEGLAEPGVLKVGLIPAEDARAVVRQVEGRDGPGRQDLEHEDRSLRRFRLQRDDRSNAQQQSRCRLDGRLRLRARHDASSG